ncbi:MAG TPA: AMP-binding protein [Burkholderiales bacterium]|nr:AMP-binding protein [Burkholderiales bacterium]
MDRPRRPLELGPKDVTVERRADGVTHLRSPHALGAYADRMTERLEHWASRAPDRSLFAQRDGDRWRSVSYGEALHKARRIGAALASKGLSAERPLVVLSGNDIEHGLLHLGAMYAGIPYAPISPAYSLLSTAPHTLGRHWETENVSNMGPPPPGVETKLIPLEGKYEARVKGPHVTPGYWRQPALTRAAFDEEGYYRLGDSFAFEDAAHPERGLLFRGRIAEDFKPATGTWVNVGPLRAKFIEHFAPLVLDEPPSLDAGELTDKGSINQRAVLTRRRPLVEELYAGSPRVITS